MQGTVEQRSCALCSLDLGSKPIVEDDRAFCCPGCHAVYNILSRKGELSNFEEAPLFQQAVQSGLISNPELLNKLRERSQKESQERQKLYLEITDLWCPSCAQVIRWVIQQDRGVHSCVVDYATDLAAIEYDPLVIGKDQIKQRILSLGYTPVSFEDRPENGVPKSLYFRLFIALFCSMNIMMFSYPVYASFFDTDYASLVPLFGWLAFFTSLPVVTYCIYPLIKRFINAFTLGFFGMETLVVMAVSAAFGFSTYQLLRGEHHLYFDSMAVIVAFVLLGKVIESRAKFSAKESLFRLTRSLPKRGRKRFADGSEAFVPLKEIQSGDQMVALTGEKIVLDGVVVEGEGSIDESLMTGESIPVHKTVKAGLLGGTLLIRGRLVYKVTATSEETVLQQIVNTVEEDISHKSKQVRLVDLLARWFVPVVCVVALLGGIHAWWGFDPASNYTLIETILLRMVSVLLISCPCAIGIAAPLAESHLMNGLANLGAVVRNRSCLSYLGKESSIVFDKTGTITEGTFHIISGLEDLSRDQKSILKGLASQSIHPISLAISEAIQEPPALIVRTEEHAGRGLLGFYNGKLYTLGSENFLREREILPSKKSDLKKGDVLSSNVFFAEENQCLSAISLGDSIRPEAKRMIDLLDTETFMLSGDASQSVEQVAKQCGFTRWEQGCSPLEKRDQIDRLRREGKVVAMLGDGINDAPALTAAHIGISVVNATDVSIQVSDILLTTDSLAVIPKIRKLAIKGRRILTQNLFWAFIYNVIGIGLAASGLLSPIYSAVAMVSSSIIVLFNAQRLQK